MTGLSFTWLIGFSLILLSAADVYDRHVRDYSRCAYPCELQRTPIIEIGTSVLVSGADDDTRSLVATKNGSIVTTVYCIERVGSFIMSGRTVNGVNEYACWKYQDYGDISIYYHIYHKPFPGRPDICEVCNGQHMDLKGYIKDCKMVISKGVGCNIPWYCPVVNSTTQKQCSRCDAPEWDDGLCCDLK